MYFEKKVSSDSLSIQTAFLNFCMGNLIAGEILVHLQVVEL